MDLQNSQKAVNKMAISPYLPIIILNVNGLNSPIKRHRMDEWIKKKQGGFPGGAVVKNPPANAGTQVQTLVWEDSTCHGATKPVHHNY